MASTIPFHFKIKKFKLSDCHQHPNTYLEVISVRPTRSPTASFYSTHRHCLYHHHHIFNPKLFSFRTTLTRACSDGGGDVDAAAQSSASADTNTLNSSSSRHGDGYVALFARMLGLDNDPLDREQAIVALWKYSLGGKQYIDAIMQFRGCLNLTVNLLKSGSSSTCEAAAGLLRAISAVNLYRDSVAESGAIEEITGLLSHVSLTSAVKEQSICTLWNLSVDEKLRVKIANTDLLPLLIKSLDDEDIKVKEAAGGVLANLALSKSLHNILVEASVIPKLAKFLKNDVDGSKVIRSESKGALLELAKDEYYRILIIEEGLVRVPVIGAAAYKSFAPSLYSWPSLPDGTVIEQSSKSPSRYGAAGLLLGLNIDDKNVDIEQNKIKAMIGRAQQQFLARVGAIETEDEKKPQSESKSQWFTLLPWMDGVARLVLILGLEDELAISRAAESIADASINEHMRISFKEAGAVKRLVQLLDYNNDSVRFAATCALERLSISNSVCQTIAAEGVTYPLVNVLKCSETSACLMEKTLDILARVVDPKKRIKSKFYKGPVTESDRGSNAVRSPDVDNEFVGNMDEMTVSISTIGEDLLDSAVITRLVDILKTSSPNLQRKASSILEFMTVIEPFLDAFLASNIESGLEAVFQQQKILDDIESDMDYQQPELHVLKVEEAGLTISAASRLLSKLLEFEQFCQSINTARFTELLRRTLKSNIPLHNKGWVADCLVKLTSFSGVNGDFDDPVNLEITLYEIVPRLIEQMKASLSPEAQEAAVMELNRIISEGVVDSSPVVAAKGGIYPLVKLIEEGSGRAVEAALSILDDLSMDAENHSAIVAAGAVPALRRIVQSHGPHPQWMRALRLLRILPIG